MAVEMDGHDRFSARGYSLFDKGWVEVEGFVINIHIDRLGPDVRNRPTSGDESKGRRDDLVPGANVKQQHRHMKSGGPAVKGYTLFRATKPGKILFELRHVGSEAKRAVVERARNSGINIFADCPHLRGQIKVGNSWNFLGPIRHVPWKIRDSGAGGQQNRREFATAHGIRRQLAGARHSVRAIIPANAPHAQSHAPCPLSPTLSPARSSRGEGEVPERGTVLGVPYPAGPSVCESYV